MAWADGFQIPQQQAKPRPLPAMPLDMKSRLIIIFSFLLLVSCNDTSSKGLNTAPKDTIVTPVTTDSLFHYNISWTDSSKTVYQVDSFLTHKGNGVLCDSAIAIDYIGFLGEHSYMPLNDKGQWINTIKKRKKITDEQLRLINSVFGNKKSFDDPMMVSCYEPRLGIVYYKKNKIIGQSAICLGCARLESTAKLGNGDNYSSFNERTLRRLENLCNDLQFSNCQFW